MVALIYCQSGGGKTVNSTRVATGKRGRNMLLCSDNSSIVLKNFDRPNLDVEPITHCMKSLTNLNDDSYFIRQLEKTIDSNKYDNIILDNISDLFDMWILELDESGKYKDMRQAYQLVYQSLKRLVRKATLANCDIVFTAWQDLTEITLPTGEKVMRTSPKIPQKILDNICGLCNIVTCIDTFLDEKSKQKVWYYKLEGSPTLYAKDQIFCRKACKPEELFSGKVEK